MLLDEIEVRLVAGHGGPGKVSFLPGKKAGPDGGNGGKGGDIVLSGTSDITALNRFSKDKIIHAQKGEGGSRQNKSGKNAEDTEIKLPQGSLIEDLVTGESWEILNLEDRIIICKGGLGGRGNAEFKSSKNTTPMYAQPGLAGQERKLKVTLKLIADIGLIGLPNVGKSSLLAELTKATPKIANYPFTTLEPNLGVLGKKVIADIPGLIEGAHQGKGLGIKFLKHIEKVNLLLHCLSAESNSILADYEAVRNELKQYNPELVKKEELILLTKSDMVTSEILKKQIQALKKLRKQIIPVSIHDFDSLETLKQQLS